MNQEKEKAKKTFWWLAQFCFMFLKVQQNTENIEEHMIMFCDEEFKFVDDSAMIIKIECQDLLVVFYIEEIYGV